MKRAAIIKKLIFFFSLLCLLNFFLTAQELSFRHLDANDGLPSNNVSITEFDNNGSLWFSTGEAINLFDGNSITSFYWKSYPVFPPREHSFFSIDSKNRVWLGYGAFLVLIDEKRQPRRYTIADSIKDLSISYVFEVSGLGMVATTNKGTFYTKDINKNWERFPWFDGLISNQSIYLVNQFDSTTYIFKLKDKLLVVDFSNKKILLDMIIPGALEGCRLNKDEILVGVRNNWVLHKISLSQKKIIKTYSDYHDQAGNPIMAKLQSIALAANDKIYIATQFRGLIEFDLQQEKFYVHTHDAMSDQSISTDNLRYLATNNDGYLAVSSRAGINIANVLQTSITSKENFKELNGNIIDEGAIGIVEDRWGKLWITTQSKLFTWDRKSNVAKTIFNVKDFSADAASGILPGIPEVDNDGKIWIPYNGFGILVYSDDGKIIKVLKRDNIFSEAQQKIATTRVLRKNKDGRLFAGSERGVFIIDPKNYSIDTITLKPLLDQMDAKRVVDIMPENNIVWVTTSPFGCIWKYDLATKSIRKYAEKDGVPSPRNYMLAKDSDGNVYAGNYSGISVIDKDGKLSTINESTGLTDHRVESIINDDRGYLWIANTNVLIRYDPSTKKFDYFNEQNGVTKSGFAAVSALHSTNRELIFGTNQGILVVHPDLVKYNPQPTRFTIYKVNTDNSMEQCRKDEKFILPYSNAKISFTYINSDLITGDRIFYRYKMEGLDTNWSAPTRNHLIAYNLRPGGYTFRMQASFNETGWVELADSVQIKVKAPFWQQWWFYVLIGLLAVGTTMAVYRSVQASKEQKRKLDELNRLMNESRLMAIRAQMNPHFIFNSLNAIQECIVMQDFDAAYQYLSKFSKLLRQVLNNSEKNFVPLKDEIEVNELYLELESLRFKKSFNFSMTVDERIDAETIKFPSLMLQPFIENAIWHGLMHKQGEKKLDISFLMVNQHLECVIEDNGIGREKSAEIKKNKLGAQYFESKGTQLSSQRIKLLNDTGYTGAAIEIDDLKENGMAKGTRVTLKIPLDNKN